MDSKKDFGDLEPVDLSTHSRGRSRSESVDFEDKEFKDLTKSVYGLLVSNSSFDKVVKVPSSVSSYLDKYEGVAFEGLVSLVLEVAGENLYHDLADNFVKAVYNFGVRASGLPQSMFLDVGGGRDTRAYHSLDASLSKYRECNVYFFHDVEKFPFPDGRYSALDVSYLLRSERLKVSDLQKQLDRVRLDYSNLSKTLNDRNLRISDLSGLVASLKNDKAQNIEFLKYHIAFPRVFRILRLRFHMVVKRFFSRLKR